MPKAVRGLYNAKYYFLILCGLVLLDTSG